MKKAAFLIHGFVSDRDDFAPLLPELEKRYDAVWCENLPDHGEGVETTIDAEKIIGYVMSEFDAIKAKYDEVDVYGFSMGGALATMLASTRVTGKLILLAPANKYLAPAFPFVKFKYYMMCVSELAQKKAGAEKRFPNIESLDDVLKDLKFSTEYFFKRLLPRYTIANLAEFNKVIKFCNDTLEEITVPTLLLWGKFDQLVPYSSIKSVLQCCSDDRSRVVVYPDITHLMLYSAAHDKIVRDILGFIDDENLQNPPQIEQKQPKSNKTNQKRPKQSKTE